jgi:hypothetical protein
VSIAALTMGTLSWMFLDNLLLTSTSPGRTAEWLGIRRRSSNVNPILNCLCSITTSALTMGRFYMTLIHQTEYRRSNAEPQIPLLSPFKKGGRPLGLALPLFRKEGLAMLNSAKGGPREAGI